MRLYAISFMSSSFYEENLHPSLNHELFLLFFKILLVSNRVPVFEFLYQNVTHRMELQPELT